MLETRRDLPDLAAMDAFGRTIAARMRIGDVIALEGTLGAGKTTLARAIIAGSGHLGEVPSPTFTIFETYDPPAVRLPIVHADFYRLEEANEIAELGIADYRDGAALIAEWPENVGGFASDPACLSIMLEASASGGRIAIARPGGDWLERWT